ncbi:MAG: nucleotidyltransferase family protein [Thaumarchaeota archaeon]|nr:nucleotidyltransferase family protein [Nitrososphaerota archaeon]
MTPIGVVILAAGLSTRFGRNKLLEKVKGISMIRRVVSEASSSKADVTVVVLGHQAAEIRRALKGLPCRFVRNDDYMEGQSSSVKTGVKVLADKVDAIIVLPGDVALVIRAAIDAVIDDYLKSRSLIVTASHRGKTGHPILFDKALFPEMTRIDEANHGLKAVLNGHKDQVHKVEVGFEGVLHDIDTWEDFKKHVLGEKGKT